LIAAQYETSFRNAARITQDLQRALSPSERQNLSPAPVLLEKVAIPFVQPGEYRTNNAPVQYVSFSDGFIDFANYLSHARAIDEYQRGFYPETTWTACDLARSQLQSLLWFVRTKPGPSIP